jgi:diaminohydroxyphosphoribosylaminopyrimidine deaminase/5-amino-6-(5-phosphoribosylamino)uracil reductase
MEGRSPVRVVLGSSLRLSADGQLVATARETPVWVLTGETASAEREQALRARGVEVLRVVSTDGRLDLQAALQRLAERGITRAMVEAGPIVSAAFLKADLVDEAALFRSPKAIGPDGIDALDDLSLDALTRSSKLASIGTETIVPDTLEWFERPH